MSGGFSVGALVLGLLAASPAESAPLTSIYTKQVVGSCIRAAAGNRPWLEKTLWGLYDQERGWAGAEIANRDGTFDLGPLQINTSWVTVIASLLKRDSRDVRRWLRDDSCFNVRVAAWIFLTGYSHPGGYWRAVGAYHSPTRWRARAYAAGVADNLRTRFGRDVFQARGDAQRVDRRRK
jgi:hypothetical protein